MEGKMTTLGPALHGGACLVVALVTSAAHEHGSWLLMGVAAVLTLALATYAICVGERERTGHRG